MIVTGIITEYNPFHNGHLYHIQKTKELTNCDLLICVMSGNFVQRGEPAVYDKWKRAKCAIEHGCDIVIELPFAFATQSATQFAKGAVDCLNLAKCDNFVFGSEIDDLDMLKKIVSLPSDMFKDILKEGCSPVKAYEMIYGQFNPNDILGINYLKACTDKTIEPLTIKRTNAYFDTALNNEIASASAIRNAMKENKDISRFTPMHHIPAQNDLERYYDTIRTLLLTLDGDYLKTLFLMDEGIEQHLIKQAKTAEDFNTFMNLAVCKRYTKAKIQRTLLHLLLQTTKQSINELPELDYLRILAFNSKGKEYLKTLKEDVKIASRFNQIPLAYRNMELKASQVYAMGLDRKEREAFMKSELQPPIYKK